MDASLRTGGDAEEPSQESAPLPAKPEILPGMAFRRRFDREWTLESASEGCVELTGYRPEDLIENKVVAYGQLVLQEDRRPTWDSIAAALETNKPYDLVYRIRTASGQDKWVRELGRGIFITGGDIPMLEGIITDITTRKASDWRIQCKVQRFEALRQLDRSLTGSLDLQAALGIFLEQVLEQLNVDAADVRLLEEGREALEYAAGRGFRTRSPKRAKLRLGEGFAGIAALERHHVFIQDLSLSPGGLDDEILVAEEGFVSYFAKPLISKGRLRGVLEIYQRSRLEPDGEWLDFLNALAAQGALAIDNVILFSELQRANLELSLAYDSALEGWSKALELWDKETEGHTKRVTEMTLRLARAFGISVKDLVHIRRGAILHDIGKMGIPDRILLKNGSLTPEEWEVIRKHPLLTYELLSPIPYLKPAMSIPFCHHERWDGSGYPRGLRGEQIPLEARIFAVADVWDSLTSDRPYRKAWPKKKAINHIREQAGKHFDPKVVEEFLRLVGET